jgi:hypothetical protein
MGRELGVGDIEPQELGVPACGQRDRALRLLLDAVAMELLRKYLVENFGVTAARTVLTQFGFAHDPSLSLSQNVS